MVFEKIQRDQRHGDVQVLAFGPATERAFRALVDGVSSASPREEHATASAEADGNTGFSTTRREGERLLDIVRGIAFEQKSARA